MERVCDNCKREPEPFETDLGETGYFFVVPKNDEPVFLMSNFELAFGVCLDRNPPDDENNDLICIRCMDEMNSED